VSGVRERKAENRRQMSDDRNGVTSLTISTIEIVLVLDLDAVGLLSISRTRTRTISAKPVH
jgi:hypothetical protein